MKIVIAPDSFKGSLTALEVADAIAEGIKRVMPEAEIDKVPMADGGEGTVQALVDATGGRIITEEVCDPLGNQIKADFGILGDGKTAVIEMATASGLPLVPADKRNPMLTTTYGTGELIRAALDRGCAKLIVGIGGSATVDGGAGMAQALGARLLDGDGDEELDMTMPVWLPISVEYYVKKQLSVLFEAEIGLNNAATYVGGGLAIYF